MTTGIRTLHFRLCTVMESTALLLNCLLLYLILKYSHFRMQSFRGIFLLACISDTVLTVIVLVGQPYNVIAGGYNFLVSNGFFSCRYPLLDHILMVGFCSMLHTHIVMLAVQFVWRNSLIREGDGRFKLSKYFLAGPIIWCLTLHGIATWCWVFEQDEIRDQGLRILDEVGFKFNNDTAPFPGMVDTNSAKLRIHNVFYASSIALVYVIVVSCQIGVRRQFRSTGAPTHVNTLRAYNEASRALIALALTPIIGVVPITVVIVFVSFGIHNENMSVYSSLGMTFITLLNPMVTMFFVRSYRRGLLRMLHVPGVASTSTTVHSSKQQPVGTIRELSLEPTAAATWQ